MKKSDYRKFIIKTVEGVDDFASMREVVTAATSAARRNKDGKKKSMPSLVLIDGGWANSTPPRNRSNPRNHQSTLASIAKREEIIYVYGQEDTPSFSTIIPRLASGPNDPRRSPSLRRNLPPQAPQIRDRPPN